MTTTDEQGAHTDLGDLREIVRQLGGALEEFSRQWTIAARRLHEQREVGALFALYRDGFLYRRGKDAPPRAEVQVQLSAALDGYEPAFLDDLAFFARWLRQQPQLADRV